MAVEAQDEAVCVLSGVRVSAVADPEAAGHGLLQLNFPGGAPIEANGDVYLRLQVIESVRFETEGTGANANSKVADRVYALLSHLQRKHQL